MARAIIRLSASIDSIFGVEDLARGLANDCHKFADFDFLSEGYGTCPSGGFRCPFGGDDVNCENITAADWLRILEVEE